MHNLRRGKPSSGVIQIGPDKRSRLRTGDVEQWQLNCFSKYWAVNDVRSRATLLKPACQYVYEPAAQLNALKSTVAIGNKGRMEARREVRTTAAFTLAEVVVCIAIVALVFGGIISGYIQGAYRAEWAGYNLAAQALAMQQLEQAKTAMWDNSHNEFTNILNRTWAVLDLPINGTNKIYATNFVQVTTNQVSISPALYIYMVRVDTVWPYIRKGQVLYYTNSLSDYYAPDDQPQ